MAKRKNAITVSFKDGQAAEHITGSCVHVTSNSINFLIECGLSQSNNIKRDYLENSALFSFSVKELKYIFIGHAHADHSLRVPLLYKRGCKATIYVPKGMYNIYRDMAIDSAKIAERDARLLSTQSGREVEPLYSEEDALRMLSFVKELEFGVVHEIDKNIKIQLTPSGHIVAAAQLEFWLTEGNTTKKIIYTSDLGNPHIKKYYVDEFQPLQKADLVIGESTYADSERSVARNKVRKDDRKVLAETIDRVCRKRRGKILIPVFALDRLPEILTELYLLLDKKCDIPIVVDTPLGLKHFNNYRQALTEDKLKLFNEVMDWKAIRTISTHIDSQVTAASDIPMIVLSSSGMMTAGRVLLYATEILRDQRNAVVFCGYSTEGSVAWQIKNKESININGVTYKRRCESIILNSYSSHMQYDSLLKYYSSLQAQRIILHHGQMKAKHDFANVLKHECEKQNRSTKIIVSDKETVINL